MKKSIIISVKPQWVEKILNGEKTIEIRKSIPKCNLPIDVYIYCTKKKSCATFYRPGELDDWDYKITHFSVKKYGTRFEQKYGGKVVAKFTLNKVSDILKNYKYKSNGKTYVNYISNCGEINWCQKACLSSLELENYLSLKNGYAWHIDNLEIFDKPMELNEFYKNNYLQIIDHLQTVGCDSYYCTHLQDDGCDIMYCPSLKIKKAPQSWCYAYKEV